MYFITYDNKIYKGDITVNGLSNCAFIANIDTHSFLPNSLTIDKNGVLYMVAGADLYKCDTNNPTVIFVGTLPDYAGGDLIFYDHDLYMAGISGIYKVNISNPGQSTLDIPMPGTSVFGLVSVIEANYKITVYALGFSSGTDMIALDLKNKVIIGKAYTLPYDVYDGASEVEEGGPPSINIQKTDVNQECEYYNRGRIEITAGQHAEVYTYTLTNTGQSNTTGIFGNLQPGDYNIHVTTNTGVDPLDIPVIIPDYSLTKPVTTYFKKIPICDLTGTIQFNMQGNSNLYSIQLGEQVYSFSHTFELLPGFYHFTLLDNKNCIVDTIRIDFTKVGDCNPISFPNTFTPNSDGVNDIFRPNQDSRAIRYQLDIYNRYGQHLFTTKDLHQGWDGASNSKPLPVGTYYWIVNYVDNKGKPAIQKGYVALLR